MSTSSSNIVASSSQAISPAAISSAASASVTGYTTYQQAFTAARTTGNAAVTTNNAGETYLSFYLAGSATAATVQNPAPSASGSEYITGSITVSNSSPARKMAKRANGDDSVWERFAKQLQQRQFTGCYFYVTENGTTIYSLNLDNVTPNQPINFNTSSYSADGNTVINYIESCPPGAQYPQINVAGLQYVVGPASLSQSAGAASVASSTQSGSAPTGSVVYITTTYTQPASTVTTTSISVSQGSTVTYTQTTTLPVSTVVSIITTTATEMATSTEQGKVFL
jgi:hypothetical protein